jgi:hypothetical protein
MSERERSSISPAIDPSKEMQKMIRAEGQFGLPRSPFKKVGFLAALLCVLGALWAVSAAQASPDEFGIESVSASASTLHAGAHPNITTALTLNPRNRPFPSIENFELDYPPGLVGNPQNFPPCTLSKFYNAFFDPCPTSSQVGIVTVQFEGSSTLREPLYVLTSNEDEIAHLGFIAFVVPFELNIDLRSGSDYGLRVVSKNIATAVEIRGIEATTWGVPADPSHDSERLSPLEALFCEGQCNGPVPSDQAPVPFNTNPANCEPLRFDFKVTSYQLPGQVFEDSASAGDVTNCGEVPFEPSLELETTNHEAGEPTGVDATLKVPLNEAPTTVNASPLKSTKVLLPEGMVINPPAANGIEGCTAAQASFETSKPASCPNGSKIGSATIVSPDLFRPINGSLYLRDPEPGHLIRFWLVSNELGINLKIPAEAELNQSTGRVAVVFPEAPNLPTEEVVLHFNGGPRAALRNPETCGTFDAHYDLEPWSGNVAVTGVAPINVDKGCATGGFRPKMSAGTVDPTAGRFSPFLFSITRNDGEQNVSSINLGFPQGLTAKLAGVGVCPEAAAPKANCPVSSQVGIARAAVGAGALPLWIPQPGKEPTAVYLAGPYKGAPYSILAKVPAQAGPFDLGTVAVRSAINIDPTTAQVSVASDPLPSILQGIPISYRNIRVETQRPEFTLNPTSCEPQAISATVASTTGASAIASDRFQAAECGSLTFAPRLTLALNGKTNRTGHPALRAVLQMKAGGANLKGVSVALPHSEFLDQSHIGTVCTRVQFAAHSCPAASVYGHATATTPLLDEPLSGPVYLRSSSHTLPDLVLALQGQNGIEIDPAARIDSIRGGIRTSFEGVPDVPVSRVVLSMRGGKRGLLVNSKDICAQSGKAVAAFDGQNGKISDMKPTLHVACGKAGKRKASHSGGK